MSTDRLKDALRKKEPLLWINPDQIRVNEAEKVLRFNKEDVLAADRRLERFSLLLKRCFPELGAVNGIIESEISSLDRLKQYLNKDSSKPITGQFWIKKDHALPVAGSIKARGGIYAVLKIAESLALAHGILPSGHEDYRLLLSLKARSFFKTQTLTVASTGNLGLSIGVMGSALGFQVVVHMSAEAMEWKKKRLRDIGVRVVEHAQDYTAACTHARSEAEHSKTIHFIDDENSHDLFLGYSVAALRLKKQLDEAHIPVNEQYPLFLYLPCGVGGAPGGITLGTKLFLGDHVHCFFAEPCQAPCMLLGMATKQHADISVYDIGLDLSTDADGLAVSRPSQFIGELMHPLLSGIYTISDEMLYRNLLNIYNKEKMELEPSAAAGISGPCMLLNTQEGKSYLDQRNLTPHMNSATHIVWSTGGSFVPKDQHAKYRSMANDLNQE